MKNKSLHIHLKDAQIGDIWEDTYSDYVLISHIEKLNPDSEKDFWVSVNTILLTNNHNVSILNVGEEIVDYQPTFLKRKIA
jgi:hypothetical protein